MKNLKVSRCSFRYLPFRCIDNCPLSCIRYIHEGGRNNVDQIKTLTKEKSSITCNHVTDRNFVNLIKASAVLRMPATYYPGFLAVKSFDSFNRKYCTKCEDNLSAVLHGVKDLRVEQAPIPKFSDDEVLLQMDCCGICGTDVHFLEHGSIGTYEVKKPMIVGHESSGVVVEVGKNVKNLEVCDRVGIEPGIPCHKCDICRRGFYNMCPKMALSGLPPNHGFLTRYHQHPANLCYKLPDHLTMEEGALLEPLSVAVHACRRAKIELGDRVLILGSGPIGLVTLVVAKSMGASNIVVTDLNEKRLKIAKKLGATHTLMTNNYSKPEAVSNCVRKLMGGEPDKSIDCIGIESSTCQAILATRPCGTVVIVGLGMAEMKLPVFHALTREVAIHGVFLYCNDFLPALALLSSRKINIKPLVTHHFDLCDAQKAFETSRDSLDGAIKVMIHMQPRDTNNACPF